MYSAIASSSWLSVHHTRSAMMSVSKVSRNLSAIELDERLLAPTRAVQNQHERRSCRHISYRENTRCSVNETTRPAAFILKLLRFKY